MDSPKEHMTQAEVAEHCKVTIKCVQRWTRSGDLASSRLGQRRYVRRTDLQEYLQAREEREGALTSQVPHTRTQAEQHRYQSEGDLWKGVATVAAYLLKRFTPDPITGDPQEEPTSKDLTALTTAAKLVSSYEFPKHHATQTRASTNNQTTSINQQTALDKLRNFARPA